MLVLLGAAAGALLSSSRHRSLHPGLSAAPGPRAASATPARAPATASPTTGPRGRRPAAPQASAPSPAPDASGRVRVPVTDLVPVRLPAAGVPDGWALTEFAGSDASIELVQSDGRVALRLRSEHNSFAVHRDIVLDVRRYPILSWIWKVSRLPAGGDVRDPGRDDQAAQVYVVFPRWPSPRTTSDVIGYVWDAGAPVGTTLTSPSAPNVRIIVVESGPDGLEQWLQQHRNVAEDYRALFGRQPPRAGKLALMIDSNDTRSEAEAMFGELTFSRPNASSHTEIPTLMLR